MKKKISLIFIVVLMVFTLFACKKEHSSPVEENVSYKISYEENDYYNLNVKNEAKENEKVEINFTDVSEFIIIEDVLYNDSKCSKDSETSYNFIMPNKDVNLKVNYSFNERLSDQYSTFNSDDKLIYVYNDKVDDVLTEKRELNVEFNMNYMTILKSDIKSTNQDVIPNDAITVKEIKEMDIIGSSGSNLIVAAKILVDSNKIKVGKTNLIMSFANGNVSGQKSNLVVEITVDNKVVHSINYNSDPNYEVFIKEYGAVTEEIYFSVEPKLNGLIIKDVYSDDTTITKGDNNRYKFIMPDKDVNIMIDYEIEEKLSDNFASYNGDKTLCIYNELLDNSMYNEYIGINFSEDFKNVSSNFVSTNQKVISDDAITISNKTELGVVKSILVTVNRKLINKGNTTLIVNVNADNKEATIIVNLTIEDRVAYKINTVKDDFAKLSISKGAEPNKKVGFSFNGTYHFVKLIEITSKDVTITKESDNYYSFIMPEKDITIDYKYDLEITTTDSIASIDSYSKTIKIFNPETDKEEDRYQLFEASFNATYMTILNMKVTATNKDIIDLDAFTKKDILDMDVVGSSGTNEVVGAKIYLDRTKIREGETYLIFEFKNGNVYKEKATLLIKVNFVK